LCKGGVTHVFFSDIFKELTDVNYSLFKPVHENTHLLFISQNSSVNEEHLAYFELFGEVFFF
jgi:hypothetical protein